MVSITTRAQQKAFLITEREKLKDKRGKLTMLLSQRLMAEHEFRSSTPKGFLRKTVAIYLDSNPTKLEWSEDLVNEVMLFVRKAYYDRKNQAQNHKYLAENDLDPSDAMKHKETILVANSKDQILNQVNPWTLIQALKVVEAEDLAETEKKRSQLKQQLMCSHLNEQLRIKESISNLEKVELSELKTRQEHELLCWKQEQDNNLLSKQQKLSELRRMRKLQLDEINHNRQKEIEAERIRSSLEIEDIRLSLKREEDEKRKKREEETNRWKKIIEENEQIAVEKSRLAAEEAEAEKRLMIAMREKVDREQEARADSMKNRVLRADDLARRVSESVIHMKENEERKRDYEILRQVQEKEKIAAEKEKTQTEERERMQVLINQSNLMIMRQKKERQERLEVQAEEHAAKCRKENEDIMSEKARMLQIEKEAKKYFKEELDKQVQERESVSKKEGMTSVERSINKKIFERIYSDDILAEKIIGKMKSFKQI